MRSTNSLWLAATRILPAYDCWKGTTSVVPIASSRSWALAPAALFVMTCVLGVTTLVAPPAQATKRPSYGGTLRVVLRASSVSLDPREWKPGSSFSAQNEQLAVLIYDRLLALDDYGRFQPALATEWSHDAGLRNWQFKLRPGVRFPDGSPLTATDVVAALQPLLPPSLQISATENAIAIHSSRPVPDLLEQFSSGRYFVYRALPDGLLLGTGPFYLGENSPAEPSETNPSVMKPAHIKFRASEEAWSGRPFLDAIEVTLGEPPLRLLYDLQIGKADLAEIAPELVRKARQENVRIWSSAPNTLLALRFDEAQPAAADQRLPGNFFFPRPRHHGQRVASKASLALRGSFAPMALRLCFSFRQSHESGPRQGNSRVSSRQGGRRQRASPFARRLVGRSHETFGGTCGSERATSQSLGSGAPPPRGRKLLRTPFRQVRPRGVTLVCVAL